MRCSFSVVASVAARRLARTLAIAEDTAVTQVQRVFLILLDISGYTRFIKFHKISLIHAERIIDSYSSE